MLDSPDSAASSDRHLPDCWQGRVVGLAMCQLVIGIIALFLLLLIGIVALSYVIAIREHYETTGSFIDLMRQIAIEFSVLVLAAPLVLVLFLRKLGSRTKAP